MTRIAALTSVAIVAAALVPSAAISRPLNMQEMSATYGSTPCNCQTVTRSEECKPEVLDPCKNCISDDGGSPGNCPLLDEPTTLYSGMTHNLCIGSSETHCVDLGVQNCYRRTTCSQTPTPFLNRACYGDYCTVILPDWQCRECFAGSTGTWVTRPHEACP